MRPSRDSVALVVLLCIVCAFHVVAAVNMPSSQYEALQNLYFATNGSNWRWFGTGARWSFDVYEDPCSARWEGIICNPFDHSVLDLTLNQHRLEGTLPPSIGNLVNLLQLNMEYNRLSGSIPNSIGKMTQLTDIKVNDNFLRGPIPPDIVKLKLVEQINFDVNRLTGTIPHNIGNMTSLVGMGLNNNRLTGTIPESVGLLKHVAGIRLHNNLLHGPIPNNLNNCTSILNIAIFNNSLTGTIPANLGELKGLALLQLSDNKLTGTIPTTLATLPVLSTLMVDNNQLTGNIEGLFDPSIQTLLSTVQVSNNQLTGTIPASVFALPLVSFAAVSNCFHGTLPDNICSGWPLTVLALDGLSSASSCQSSMLPGLSKSYLVSRPVHGSVPVCLFNLPNLYTLHLSGNGFTGNLPLNLNVSRSLLDLSLSHNQLTGTIPLSLQSRNWTNLDLSFNYLQGTLSPDFTPALEGTLQIFNESQVVGTSFSLENNRLSGVVPHALVDAFSVSVLRGNLFSCRADRENIPSADDNASNYQCGSQSLEAVYFAWLGLVSVLLMLCGVLWLAQRGSLRLPQRMKSTWEEVQQWYGAIEEMNVHGKELYRVLHLYQDVVRTCVYAGSFLLLVFLPLYGLMKLTFSTHTHQYAWSVSVAFQSGSIAVGLELAALILFLTFVVLLLQSLQARHNDLVAAIPADADSHGKSMNTLRSNLVLLVYAFLNTVVVVGVNIAFVYISLRKSNAVVSASQVALAMFKMCWNDLSASGRMVVQLSRWISPASLVHSATGSTAAQLQGYHAERANFLMLAVALFNTLAIPCLVVLVVSPDCFYNIFVPAASVVSHYTIPQCTNADGVTCQTYRPFPQTTSYDPPFKYSYQCSSSFVTYYTPAFVYMCLMATFGSPTMQWAALYVSRRVPRGYVYVHWGINLFIPRILRPLSAASLSEESNAGTHTVNPLSGSNELEKVKRSAMTSVDSQPAISPRLYFNANRYFLSFLTYLGLLLTFGLAYPPLAACVVAAVVSMLLYLRLCLGKFLHTTREENKQFLLRILDEACVNVGGARFITQAAWLVVGFSSVFYTLFLFDTLGDAEGLSNAYWVLIVVPLVPVYVYLLQWLCEYLWKAFTVENGSVVRTQNNKSEGQELELHCVQKVHAHQDSC